MLLAIDIGNSDIVLGIFLENEWKHIWRIKSLTEEPETAYSVRIADYFLESGLKTADIEIVVLSSVVPDLTPKIKNILLTFFRKKPIILGPDIYSQLPVNINNPYEIGSDLVSNAVAAFSKYQQGCIVVDFGTALTFTTVSGKGEILGVAIAPGLKTAIKSLSQNTAKLPDVPLEMPVSVLGNNTVQAIQAGILLGYEGLVKSMINRIRTEVNEEFIAIATGGLSAIISPLRSSFYSVEPNLTLDGLKIIGERMGNQ